jgi:hypothetical protein
MTISDPWLHSVSAPIGFACGYKRDLDRNRTAVRAVRRELARRGHGLTEVRILDLLIWSVQAAD